MRRVRHRSCRYRAAPYPRAIAPNRDVFALPRRAIPATVPTTQAHRESADYNTKIVHPLVRWITLQRGQEAARVLAERAGLSLDVIDGRNHWISQARFESFLEYARATFPDDESFKLACVYRMSEGYGPMRYALWATSPSGVYAQAERGYKLAAAIGEPHVLSSSRTALHVRITSDRMISRLNCLIRQAQTAYLPTFWGLPPATVRETACVARGDDACEYHLRYFDRRRWLPTLVGAIVGGVAASAAVKFGLAQFASTAALPLLGGSIGFAIEQQRTGRANLDVGEEQNAALRAIAEEENEARRELLAMHQRQRDWTRLLEEDAVERAAGIQAVVDGIHRTQEARDRQLRGFSHDLRSPLSVIQLGTQYLSRTMRSQEQGTRDVIIELEHAVDRMQRMLEELMEAASAAAHVSQIAPERLEVEALTDRLRRRLRAIVYGRDIRVTVFRTREAPDSIEADPLLLDRITDNLLSNAAKYTERGSIVIEVDGVPDFVVLKISDSGRGIAPEEIERAFQPGGSDKNNRAADSYGLGLSVVVQLLAQIGGRLEVMSKPDVGTTFWVHVPVRARAISTPPPRREPERLDDLVQRVVTIRRVNKGA